jgi:hypothetical protein
VPNAIAHDGFPDAAPFSFKENHNSLTIMIQNMAEYLAMVEVFFANSRLFGNCVIVPKKATKAAYHGAFFNTAFGSQTEYWITLRHRWRRIDMRLRGFRRRQIRVRGNIRRHAAIMNMPKPTRKNSDWDDVYQATGSNTVSS